MTSISLTSGNPSTAPRANSAPRAVAGSTGGTSSGGSSKPRLPATEFSKISRSLRLMWRAVLFVFSVIPFSLAGSSMVPVRVVILDRQLEGAARGSDQMVDFRPRMRFRDAIKAALGQLGAEVSQWQRADDFFPQ